MGVAENPILRGFNPDPSIIRVGEDYYIATSTFEWFPGVQIHHSRDLANWELCCRPLQRVSQLDLRGVPDSGGVWAPCLSYHQGTYYLVYTNVTNCPTALKDTHNYLVTSDRIDGEWSEPVFLNSFGFDPSMFHDDDGRKWVVTMETDFRKGVRFSGILLQEYDPNCRRCVGPVRKIFRGTSIGLTEGPHLYKYNGWYYLITAEGGTEYNHSVTVARSRSIEGPYEVDPQNPILTASDKPEQYLQKTGHADLVQTQDGSWYLVHLAGRPITAQRRCVLGRESCIQRLVYTPDGWFRLANGGNGADRFTQTPFSANQQPKEVEKHYTFTENSPLPLDFQTLRIPFDTFGSLTDRPGFLRLYGRESCGSLHRQALVARRQQAFVFTAETAVEFEPDYFKEMAGLVYYYNTRNYYFLRFTHDEEAGRCVALLQCDNGVLSDSDYLPVGPQCQKLWLRLEVCYEAARFFYSTDGVSYRPVGGVCDASRLSDDYVQRPAFTGAFVGVCAQDMSGFGKPADFAYFDYCERKEQPQQ